MLTPLHTRRLVIASSLFAAVCAGYVAGQRSPLYRNDEFPPLLPIPLTDAQKLSGAAALSPRSTGGGVTAALMPESSTPALQDAQLKALLDITEVKTWDVLVRADPKAARVLYRLEVREAGKVPVPLVESMMGVNYADAAKGQTFHATVALMPILGTLSTAEKLRARVACSNFSLSQDNPNPFHNWMSMSTVSNNVNLPGTLQHKLAPFTTVVKNAPAPKGSLAEVPLLQVGFDNGSKPPHVKVLYLTFRAQYN